MSSFKRWWKVNGQGIGFIAGIVFLNAYFLILGDLMNKHEWLAGVWLLCFFGFAGWCITRRGCGQRIRAS